MHDIDEEIKKLIDENTDETETQSEADTSSEMDAEKLATVLEEIASKILTFPKEENVDKMTVEEATKKALVKKILATQHAASGGN